MAIVAMLAGGMMGFFSALVGLIILNISWFAALGVWTGVGTLCGIAFLVVAMLPRKSTLTPVPAPLVAKIA